ncbi:MAG: carbohydrate ABC transporter permease [Anaerolineaceae bacterium]|nr:carbohydrate ABC transporter permease [Anaerolineaceae bacterium]
MAKMLHYIKVHFRIGGLIRWIMAILFAILALFPLWWMFNIVFSEPGIPIAINPRLYPTSLSAGIENIKQVLSQANVLAAYGHSLAYAFLTVAGSLLLTSMAAYEFALFDFPGKNVLFGIVLVALMIPTAVTLVPTYLLVARLGWVNSMQGLVVPGLASAFGLFMLTQFFKDIPREIMDASLVDGDTHLGTYWHVVLPLSKNALVTLAILTFMTTWGNYVWPMVIAKNNDIITVSQMINWYNDPNSFMTVNLMMTAFFLAAILPIIVYIFFQRQIIQGISITGLKG